jgi:hypothetical protein
MSDRSRQPRVIRERDVRSERAWLMPTAHCRGVLDRESTNTIDGSPKVLVPCQAEFQYAVGMEFDPIQVTRWAKQHAMHNPGHEVVWEKREIAVYYVDPLSPTPEQP